MSGSDLSHTSTLGPDAHAKLAADVGGIGGFLADRRWSQLVRQINLIGCTVTEIGAHKEIRGKKGKATSALNFHLCLSAGALYSFHQTCFRLEVAIFTFLSTVYSSDFHFVKTKTDC